MVEAADFANRDDLPSSGRSIGRPWGASLSSDR